MQKISICNPIKVTKIHFTVTKEILGKEKVVIVGKDSKVMV